MGWRPEGRAWERCGARRCPGCAAFDRGAEIRSWSQPLGFRGKVWAPGDQFGSGWDEGSLDRAALGELGQGTRDRMEGVWAP